MANEIDRLYHSQMESISGRFRITINETLYGLKKPFLVEEAIHYPRARENKVFSKIAHF